MSKNKIVVILFLVLITSVSTFAQETTNSPYSRYGIGIIRPQSFSQNFALGGVGIGLRSHRDIHIKNPASYSAIKVTTFDIGYTNGGLWLDDGSETQYESNSYIDHIAFAFPMVKNVWGMSFGILPYSNVGYAYDEIINDPIAGDVSLYNEGSGAINKFYFGNALGIALDTTSTLSFGANTYFYFGAMNYDQKAIYGDLPNAFNVWRVKDVSVADFGMDFGLQYQKTFKNAADEKYNLTVGATYGLAADLSAKRTELLRSFIGNTDFGTIKDTISFDDDVDEVIQLPAELGFGFSIQKQGKWMLALDYKTSNWGSITSTENIYSYKSNYSINAGFEFIPRHDGSSYFQRMAYRVGTRYSDSYIVVDNLDWTEYGITFGLGLPIRRAESSFPRLNLGIESGNRGTTDSGLIKEKFVNFNVGVTINATWFRKRKYD